MKSNLNLNSSQIIWIRGDYHVSKQGLRGCYCIVKPASLMSSSDWARMIICQAGRLESSSSLVELILVVRSQSLTDQAPSSILLFPPDDYSESGLITGCVAPSRGL